MKTKVTAVFAISFVLGTTAVVLTGANKSVKDSQSKSAILWQEPEDIASRNLYYGPGGKDHAPVGTGFVFIDEDKNGSNPKFNVRDANGVKWKIKLGTEVRGETTASRLVWAVGYFTDEDYFLPELRVTGIKDISRGKDQIGADGTMHNARLKRNIEGRKKIGDWSWHENPFENTRELNGLRVMMALLNNWDLKDVNNAVFRQKDPPEMIYQVSDLGASLGLTHLNVKRTKADLDAFRDSPFLLGSTSSTVDFAVPGSPSPIIAFNPKQYFYRRGLNSIGKNIPRDDVRWIGALLARLSPEQIRDAFRAAGYAPEEVEGYAKVIERRIAVLNDL